MPLSMADVMEEIAGHIRSGNTKEISKYFGESVDMKIFDKEDVYSKSQAELLIKDFFSKNPPKSFNINHNGISKNGAKFAIGSYATAAGTYKIYYLLKKQGDSFIIQQFRIENQE